MGRTTALMVPQYDGVTHDFFEAEVNSAPYTFGVFDKETQACGIVKKSGVSQNSTEISAKLEKLLNSSAIPEQAGVRIVVDPISDPQGFIEQLRNSSSITKFSFTASFENPFDVNELIQRPAEKFAEIAGADKAKVEVEGESLNEEVLEELARGVASTGETAAATIRQEGVTRGKRIYLKGNPVQEAIEEGDSPRTIYAAIWDATKIGYSRVRNAVI